MSNIKLFAKIHSTKELGKGNLIIDIEIISLDDKGLLPNTDFIIKLGEIIKKRTTNNEGVYRNDEVLESENVFNKIELQNKKGENISDYYLPITTSNSSYEVKDVSISIDDILIENVEEYIYFHIIWHIYEKEHINKGQLIASLSIYHHLKEDAVIKEGMSRFGVEKTIYFKAKEKGVFIKKNIGEVGEGSIGVMSEIPIDLNNSLLIIGQYKKEI